MPSHFKVKEYCPLVFRAFREYWKVHDSSFRVSFKIEFFLIKKKIFFFTKDSLTEPPIPMNEPTKSNLALYQSYDRRFVLKCIAKEDVEQIHNILPEYHRVMSIFLNQNFELFFCSI